MEALVGRIGRISKRRKLTIGLVAITTLAAVCGVATAATPTQGLLVSSNANRSTPEALASSHLNGNAYVFISRANVTNVKFYLDDPTQKAAPYSIETLAPFDLARTAANGSANPLDTAQLTNGKHTVVAVVTLTNKRTRIYSSNFTTINGTTPPTSTSSTTSTTSTTAKPTTTTSTMKPTTTTSTSTSTTVIANGQCVGAKNEPGGSDGMGGCWPGPQNTGYPHGLPGDNRKPVTLTNYTGGSTISKCGVVIDSQIVDTDLLITAGNGTHSPNTPCVTIKNSLVKGTIHTDNTDQGPVVITDTEVAVPADSWWASIGFYNTFTWRVNSHGGQGTIKCADYCASYDSWVHSMLLDREYHYNAFGGNGIEPTDGYFIIEHAYASCGDFYAKSASAVPGPAGCSGDIGFYGDFAPIRNITIDKTYFAPASSKTWIIDTQPGYCFNNGYYPGKPYPDPSNIKFTNNVFARGETGKCGVFGAGNTWLSGNGNVWSNNKYDDGSIANPI